MKLHFTVKFQGLAPHSVLGRSNTLSVIYDMRM